MRNIFLIARDGIRRLFSNVVSIIIVVGLTVLPSAFAWYNLLACWDVFENTNHLTIAVANEDTGYRSDLIPLKVNIGEQVLSSLRSSNDFGWVFTSEEDALDGTKAGRYYAAVVIPESFSQDMLTLDFLASDHADIVYYDNEKKNAIAPMLTGRGVDSVSIQVNQAFAETVVEVGAGVLQSLSHYIESDNGAARVAELSTKIRQTGERLGQTADALALYVSLLDSAQSLAVGSTGLLKSLGSQVDEVGVITAQGADTIASSVQAIDTLNVDVGRAFDSCEASLEQIIAVAELLHDDEGLAVANQALVDVRQLRADYDSASQNASSVFGQAAASLKSSVNEVTQLLDGLSATLVGSVGKVADELGVATGELSSVEEKLNDFSERLISLTDQIDEALSSDDYQTITDILGKTAEDIASSLTTPVSVERTAFFPVKDFGSAMAPLYCVLALFIGPLIVSVTLKPRPAEQTLNKARNASNRHIFLGHFGVFAFVSLLQSTLMALGNLVFLHVQAAEPLLYLLCFWITGLVFCFIVYTLAVTCSNLGKGIAVLLLIVQVTGCDGSYPLQLLPGFVQSISPWLPATHAVHAMRAAMMGIYQGDYWIQIGLLLLFVIPFAIIGLVLSKPFQRFIGSYLKKVEKSKLMS